MDRVKLNRPRFVLADDTQKRYVTSPGEPYTPEELAAMVMEEENIREARMPNPIADGIKDRNNAKFYNEIGSMTDADWDAYNNEVRKDNNTKFETLKKRFGQ